MGDFREAESIVRDRAAGNRFEGFSQSRSAGAKRMLGSRPHTPPTRKIRNLAFEHAFDCGTLFLRNCRGVQSTHNVIPVTLANGNLYANVCEVILCGGYRSRTNSSKALASTVRPCSSKERILT